MMIVAMLGELWKAEQPRKGEAFMLSVYGIIRGNGRRKNSNQCVLSSPTTLI